ncbi:MAG: hypothetical protein Q9166_002009 [cf. Caloplaca sp. 2 TL-2023]
MLSFLQNFGKRKSSSQPVITRSDSTDSGLLSSSNGTSSKGDKDSTPATSTADTASIAFDTTPKFRERGERNRSLRTSRSNIRSYNENILSGSAKHGYRKKGLDIGSRAVSGETLVVGRNDSPMNFAQQSTQGLNQSWSLGSLPGDNISMATKAEDGAMRRKSTRLSVFDFASSVMEQTRTVLGKRGRESTEGGNEQTPVIKQETRHIVTSLDVETPSFAGPVNKRLRLANDLEHQSSIPTAKVQRKPSTRSAKRWLSQGLYVGQDPDFNPRLTTAKNKLKKANAKQDTLQRRSMLPLPMFAGQRILETGRNFKLPFDVFSPLPPGQPKPDEWKKTHKSKWGLDSYMI